MAFWVYIMTNRRHGTLYVGVTNSLARRVTEHKERRGSDFLRRYRMYLLAYAESFDTPQAAIDHEKRLKRWARSWKLDLIDRHNPGWDDLSGNVHLD